MRNSNVFFLSMLLVALVLTDALMGATPEFAPRDTSALKKDGSTSMLGNFRLNLKWLSSDGDNEGVYVDGSGNVVIGKPVTPTGIFEVFYASSGMTRGDFLVDSANSKIYIGRLSNVAGDHSILVIRDRVGTEQLVVDMISAKTYFTNGNVIVGSSIDDLTHKLQVTGSMSVTEFAQLASPTAIPAAVEGNVYYNGSTHKLMVYDGSAWRACW